VESVTIRTTHRVYGPSRATDVVPQFEPQHASHTLTAMTPDLPAGVPSPMAQAAILGGFLGFQSLDALTTHLGLALQHLEVNALMRPVIANHGELAAFAVKGAAVGVLLATLMLLQHSKPRVWQAFRVAAWVTALAVTINVIQLV